MRALRQVWRPIRAALSVALAAVALAAPLPAYPLTLPQLLTLPLEELLRLRIAVPATVDRHNRLATVQSAGPDCGGRS